MRVNASGVGVSSVLGAVSLCCAEEEAGESMAARAKVLEESCGAL